MIFITGYPRSGTTLLSSIISKATGHYIGPETQFYRILNKKIKHSNSNSWIKLIENDKRMSDYNLSHEVIKKCVSKSKNNQSGLLYSLLSANRDLKGFKGQIIEKSPAHILYHSEIFDDYPDSKMIFLVRDPRDVVISNLKVSWTHNSILKHCIEWNLYIDQYKLICDTKPSQIKLVRYEDLLRDESAVISDILLWLDLEVLDQKIGEYEAVPDWEKAWKTNSVKDTNRANIAVWKRNHDKATIRFIEEICRDYFEYLNYELETVPNIKGRLLRVLVNNNLIKRVLFKRRVSI